MLVLSVRHAWPEQPVFTIDRKKGIDNITFLHFHNSVEMLVEGKIIKTKPGACIFYAAFAPQWFRSYQMIVHDWAHLNVYASSLLRKYGIQMNKIYYPEDPKFITQIMHQIETEYFFDYPFKEEIIALRFEELLIKLSRAIKGTEEKMIPEGKEARQFHDIRSDILMRPFEKWTVEAIASRLSLSPSRFHAIYKSMFGTTPMDDVIKARLRTAKNILRNTKEPIKEVAYQCGYESESHFIRQFKRFEGVSPGKYRKDFLSK